MMTDTKLHLTAKIDYVPPSPNRLLHAHWKKVYDAKQIVAAYVLSGVGWNHGSTPAKVRLTITQHRKRELDRDNLYGSVKYCVDSLVRFGWAADDRSANMDLKVEQVRCTRGEKPWTQIEIEEV